VLLALPDSSIYNSKTVKNILLTSYRQRKPIIAFSNNFVNAGALASINSSTEQIADSASKLIEQFFDSDMTFERSTNYPDEFDISINRQVFWALDLIIPDINKIKPSLQNNAGALP
jgi:putative ABC transport system substrate-binding protein